VEMITPLLVIVIALVLIAEFFNGLTDAPNAIATVVATRVMSPKNAIVVAVIGNIVGTFAGTAVAATVGKGIVDQNIMSLELLAGAMLSIIGWAAFAMYRGLPISKSHALVAGLAGAGVAAGGWGALEWSGWVKVLYGLPISLIAGLVAAFLIGVAIQVFFASADARKCKRTFGTLQIASASFMAFNHGMNDGQKFVGVLTLVLVKAAVLTKFEVLWPVVLVCSLTMGLGTAFGGWRILRTLGEKLGRIDSWQGFSAETGASCLIFAASHYGIPLSTTHTITSSIVGSSASHRFSKVNLAVLRGILLAWVVTFPVCMLIAFVVCSVILWFR
jgi:inorganic phosphate transporter, PiT family